MYETVYFPTRNENDKDGYDSPVAMYIKVIISVLR